MKNLFIFRALSCAFSRHGACSLRVNNHLMNSRHCEDLAEAQPMDTVITSFWMKVLNSQLSLRGFGRKSFNGHRHCEGSDSVPKQSINQCRRKGDDQKILSKFIFSGLPHSRWLPAMTAADSMKTPVGQAMPDNSKKHAAFSLVEMLMALLVASLLLAALAPVMTKRMNENLHITGDFSHNGKSEIVDIEFGGPYCKDIIKDALGNPLYCEGEYPVKEGYNNITVTAIGAGGGGGTAPTAGYVEYTIPGDNYAFKVPIMVNELEITTISGGAGGGAGGQAFINKDFTSGGGLLYWDVPEIVKGKYALATGCGGGGGGGGYSTYAGGGGGSGGYIVNYPFLMTNVNTIEIGIGGGGGAGGNDNAKGNPGRAWDGGGGGSGVDYNANSGSSGLSTGRGGSSPTDRGGYGGYGGNYGAGNGESGAILDAYIHGGAGAYGGGKGGDAVRSADFASVLSNNSRSGGGGGGGGSYQGGGGGGAGGGSGGGGGGSTNIKPGGAGSGGNDGANLLFKAAGGGGGGGGRGFINNVPTANAGGGGGGGGGYGGGAGGNGGGIDADGKISFTSEGSPGQGGAGGNPGVGTIGGQVSTIFGNNFCSGGNSSSDGKDGALRISYLTYGTGGSGGGSGRVHANRHVYVNPSDDLSIRIGRGGYGGTAGYIGDSGEISPKDADVHSTVSYNVTTNVKSGNSVIVGDGEDVRYGAGSNRGTYLGVACGHYDSVSGIEYSNYSGGGCIFSALGQACPVNGGMSGSYPDGFITTNGNPAGHPVGQSSLNCNLASMLNGTSGGRGGVVTTPWFTCVPGKGGETSGERGGDAAGYGCGGGGGYGLSDGGRGSGGYARIAWNMYWDAATNAYKASTLGAGGGGAAGNIIKETIRVNSGQVIKIRIGAGGVGARVVNGEIAPSTSGGATIFGDSNFIEIKAGGGGGGGSPAIKNGEMQKGEGGKPSNICSVGSRNYINNDKYCTKGASGNTAEDDGVNSQIGGIGASFSYTFGGKTYLGQGGGGGMQSTEEVNSRGKNAEGTGSGGGGSALLMHNQVANLSQLNYSQGGSGANGRIILQLWE